MFLVGAGDFRIEENGGNLAPRFLTLEHCNQTLNETEPSIKEH
jgi:hypothetical protein